MLGDATELACVEDFEGPVASWYLIVYAPV